LETFYLLSKYQKWNKLGKVITIEYSQPKIASASPGYIKKLIVKK